MSMKTGQRGGRYQCEGPYGHARGKRTHTENLQRAFDEASGSPLRQLSGIELARLIGLTNSQRRIYWMFLGFTPVYSEVP